MPTSCVCSCACTSPLSSPHILSPHGMAQCLLVPQLGRASTDTLPPLPEPPASRKEQDSVSAPSTQHRAKTEGAIWLCWVKSYKMTNPLQPHFLPQEQTHPPLSYRLTLIYPHTKTPYPALHIHTNGGHTLHTLAHNDRYACTHRTPYTSVADP